MKTACVKIIVITLSFLVLILQGCKPSDDSSSHEEYGPTLKSREPCLPLIPKGDVSIDEIEGTGQYTLELGETSKDVCLIFTNSNRYNTGSSVVINSQRINLSKADYFESSSLQEKSDFDRKTLTEYARKRGIGLKGTPEITEFNANPPKFTVGSPREPKADRTPNSIGDTVTFFDLNSKEIDATLQDITEDNGVRLNIWVGNESFEDCDKAHCLLPEMIEQFGKKFLQSGTGNDIYDWGVDIFGEPWGEYEGAIGNLISSGAASQIDILFYDIDNDNSILGGVLGAFWSRDSYTDHSFSNQRLMFYMDSVMSATPCKPIYGECAPSDNWEINGFWPAIMVSTLAHEFQHMIHFYQKQVKGRSSVGNTKPWLTEMASMVAEDLLADKMLINGPRGVEYDTSSDGNSGNESGRLPLYNYFNYKTVSGDYWGELKEVLINYSVNYAFGAYLARNYGGAALFREIVQSQHLDHEAIEEAFDALGYSSVSFADALKNWGIAAVLSNRTNAPAGQQYNTGGYFTSNGSSEIEYNLGSINLYNYCDIDSGLCGPRGLYLEDLNNLGRHYKTSNTFVKLGSDMTGDIVLNITLPEGVKATAVIADSE